MSMINPKILVVEDDSFMLHLLTNIFKSNGYDVYPVSSHAEAIPKAKAVQPDVILLDIHLDDGYTGYNIADELKLDKSLASIPTIFLTGEKDDDLRCKAFMCGGLDFLRKPFDKQDLLNRVSPLAAIGKIMKMLTKLNKE